MVDVCVCSVSVILKFKTWAMIINWSVEVGMCFTGSMLRRYSFL